jgi:serine/threonine protein kinase
MDLDLERIGPYRIVRKLGQGGMGAVYEAVHEEIARSVAIKVLHTEGGSHPELTARFLNEARAVNIIRHRSIVGISDLGRLADGTPYIVMEHLDGVTLRRRSQAGLPPLAVLRLCRQVASALAAAHDKGIIHRDLKPDEDGLRVLRREAVGREGLAEGSRQTCERSADDQHPYLQSPGLPAM